LEASHHGLPVCIKTQQFNRSKMKKNSTGARREKQSPYSGESPFLPMAEARGFQGDKF
jgi:hypothetical protein